MDVDSLVPRPRQVERTGGPGALDPVAVARADGLPPQGYELVVGPSGTTLRHADDAGRRYGEDTLAQLAAGGEVTAGRIVDWPDVATRGFMLDISRDRVPTRDTLRWLVAQLAASRYNHLELYTEHTFAYRDHHIVWQDASPLSADDLRWLDGLCRRSGIELVANQNTFGHMERWLRHEPYRSRAECPDGARGLTGEPVPPSCLAPTHANARFAIGLVVEMAENLRATTVHIGGDEPFDLGQCVSAVAVAARGVQAVYLEHLRRIVEPLVARGHHVLFWGDVLRRHPELVAQLPASGATAVVWNYEAPSAPDDSWTSVLPEDFAVRLGLPDDAHLGFAAHTRSYADTGYPFWVAPGTSSWNSLLGRWTNARANLADAAEVAITRESHGFLVTDWGDNGHLQPLAVSLAPIVYGGAVAWCLDTNRDLDVAPILDVRFGDRTGRLGSLLVDLGDLHDATGLTGINSSPVFNAVVRNPLGMDLGTFDPERWSDALERVEAALEVLGSVDLPGSDGARTLAGLTAVTRLARQGLWRLGARHGSPVPPPGALTDDLDACITLQRAAWLAGARPGGLRDSLAKLTG